MAQKNPQKKLKIALFGGSFDPPHPGHKAVLKKLLHEKTFDEIWIIPVFHHPFGKKISPYETRLALLKTMVEDLANSALKIIEVEKEIGKNPCYTLDVVKNLKSKFPLHRFTFVAGSDIKQDLPKWHGYEDLKNEIDFYFVKRKGYEDSDLPEISSTEIRNKNIYLTGFMGAGKSTIGKCLAKKLARNFVDTDLAIQDKTGKTIPEIFAEHGETYFRELETKTLEQIAKDKNQVVSLGGGIIASDKNRKILDKGLWIFIDTPLDTLKERVMNSKKRPLAQDSTKFDALYKERLPLYRLAHITVDHPGLESEEVCELVLKRILTHENS